MRLKLFTVLSIVLLFILQATVFAKITNGPRRAGAKNSIGRLSKSADLNLNPAKTILNINNITSWVERNGFFPWDYPGGWNGSHPKGTVGVVFAEGIVWGAKVSGDGDPISPRVNGSTYENGLSAGKVRGWSVDPVTGAYTAPTGIDTHADQQIWRVRADYTTADLTSDAASFIQIPIGDVSDADVQEIYETYDYAWNNWPAADGAPYEDVNGNGSYDPAEDIPGFPGASQTIWLVANDLDSIISVLPYGSRPIGLEMQMTLWGYDFASTSPLGNITYKSVKIIYTGKLGGSSTARIDTMYISQWSDPDLGFFTDDYVGTDVEKSLGYVYNGNAQDPVYFGDFGLPVPAAGYDFLQGPIVDGDTLGMSSFTFFGAGSAVDDPDLGVYEGTLQWFNLMEGFLPRPSYPTQQPLLDPLTGEETKFWLSGDPVTGQGWIDGIILPPGDRRLIMTTGPFAMALGDTQELFMALMGGTGLDNISSITVMKFHDDFAQFAYDNNFDLPSPPIAPISTGSGFALESNSNQGRVTLSWNIDKSDRAATEDAVSKGFVFEGYNVYQLPNATSTLSEGVKVATYDLENLVQTIFDPGVDVNSGFIVQQAKQSGSNSGLQHYFTTTNDAVRGRPLSTGIEYFYAVTAYSYLADNVGRPFKTLESSPVILSVRPQSPMPGTSYDAIFGDLVVVTHATGASDGVIRGTVIDPSELNGHSYEITFTEDIDTNSTTFGDLLWTLMDNTTGTTTLSDQVQFSDIDADLTQLIIDGLHIQVQGPPFDFHGSGAGIIEVAHPAGDPCGDAAGSTGGCSTYGGNTVWHSPNSTGDYRVGAGGGSGDLERMRRYIEFALPRDFEIRFTDAGGWGVYAFEDDMIATVPFELWAIGIGTPDDPSDDVRMIPFILSNDDSTKAAWGWATGEDPALGLPASDWVYWMDPEGTDGYEKFASFCEANGAGGSYPWNTDGSVDGYWANFYGGFVYPIGRSTYLDNTDDLSGQPPTGTVIRFLTTKPIAVDDSYTFTAPTVTSGDATAAAADVEKINVFPNPYLGLHANETSRFDKFVTFNHLPEKATIRLFSLGGEMVRVINKEDTSQFLKWDLTNEGGFPVASGIYIVHIDMGDLGTKILKIALVQEEQILRTY